jgi:hypothetical protein
MRAIPSVSRQQRVDETKTRLTDALTFRVQSGEPALSRLRRLRGILALASTIEDARQDDEVIARAPAAAAAAADERTKVAVIGAERSIAAELLGVRADPSAVTLQAVISAVVVYASIRSERCTGIYLVGYERGARVLNDAAHRDTTGRLLSQVLGRKVALPQPPEKASGKVPTMSRWTVAGAPILARWRDRDLIELRIGEVKL